MIAFHPARLAALLFAAVLASMATTSNAASDATSVRDEGWFEQARAVPTGRNLRLVDIEAAAGRTTADVLVLERIKVVADDAVLRIDGGDPVALNVARSYFIGHLEDRPGSRVTLVLADDGTARGLIQDGGEMLALGRSRSGGLVLAPVAADSRSRNFSCGNAAAGLAPLPIDAPSIENPDAPAVRGVPAGGFIARVALETDHEYFQLFGNIADATAYAADLIAFSSTIYSAEADTQLGVSSISLWTTPSDPWGQSDTLCQLYEFGDEWNRNNSDVERTLAHFLSGRGLGGGIAWVGVLCASGGFNTNNVSCPGLNSSGFYGGDYGVSASLTGAFDIDNPDSVWDIVVTAHEIGHNFDSPHTHCYAGIDGVADDVDQCYGVQNGCYSGPASLPGPPGQGSGTIMSYCHLRSPGLSNIGLTLGLDHPFGVSPERVPNRMLAHVIQRESSFPGCLTTPLTVNEDLYLDGFETLTSQ